MNNYKTCAMETIKFEEEFKEIENILTNMYHNFKNSIQEHNRTLLQSLNDNAFKNYSSSLKKVKNKH